MYFWKIRDIFHIVIFVTGTKTLGMHNSIRLILHYRHAQLFFEGVTCLLYKLLHSGRENI